MERNGILENQKFVQLIWGMESTPEPMHCINGQWYTVGNSGGAWHITPTNKRYMCDQVYRAHLCESGKWYTGKRESDGRVIVFRCPFEPTEATHGRYFGYTWGGYATEHIAREVALYQYGEMAY